MRVLITRPREDGAAIATLLRARGHETLAAPLLEPRWQDGPTLTLEGVAAILATSANGIRAFVRRSARRDIPVFAVGPQTTQEARDAGFTRVENADGAARALAAAVPGWMAPQDGALLHVCGEESTGGIAEALTAAGFTVRREILYAVEALALPQEARAALAQGVVDAALFFSPRSARLFVEATKAMPLTGVTAYCISPATAAAIAPGLFGAVRVAPRPNQDSLLALLG